MDVWEEIDYLKQRVSAVYDAAQETGATAPMPDVRDTWHLSSYVESIQPPPIQDDWCLPYGWPDLRKVIDNDPFKDTARVAKRTALLIEVDTTDNLPEVYGLSAMTKGALPIYGTANNGVGFRTSNDPNTLSSWPTSNVDTIIDWDPTKFIDGANGQKFVWVELYQTAAGVFGWSSGNSTIGGSWQGLLWIHGDKDSVLDCTVRFANNLKAMTGFKAIYAASYQFQNANLETIPPLSARQLTTSLNDSFDSCAIRKINFAEGGYPLSATNWTRFAQATMLEEIPDIFFEGNMVQNAYAVFANCYHVKTFPEVMDFSQLTAYQTNIQNHVWTLRQAPTKMPKRTIWPVVTTAWTFSQMGNIPIPEVARFTANNELSGGWMYGWEKSPQQSTTLSVNLQSNQHLTRYFSQAQRQALSAYLLDEKDIYIYNY